MSQPEFGSNAKLNQAGTQGSTAWISKLSHGVFGTAFVMAKDNGARTSLRTVLLFQALELLQLLSFPLGLMPSSPTLTAVQDVLDSLATAAVKRLLTSVQYSIILAVVMVLVAMFLGLAVLVAWRFVTDSPQQAGSLRVLRAMGQLFPTILFLPFSGVLMQTFVCEPAATHWMHTALECGGAGHVALGAVVGCILFLFTLLSLFVAATIIDQNPASSSFGARTHGRIDTMVILLKLLLVLLWKVTGDDTASWSRQVALTMSFALLGLGVLWVAAQVYYLPRIRMVANATNIGTGCVFVWCSLGAVFAQIPGDGQDGDPGPTVLVGCLVVFVAGYLATMRRVDFLTKLPVSSVKGSAASLDLWARLKLRAFLRCPQFQRYVQDRGSEPGGNTGQVPLMVLVEDWHTRLEANHTGRTNHRPAAAAAPTARRTVGPESAGRSVNDGASVWGRDSFVGVAADQRTLPTSPAGLPRTRSRRVLDHTGPRALEDGPPRLLAESDEEAHQAAAANEDPRYSGAHRRRLETELAAAALHDAVSVYEALPKLFPASELACVFAASFWQAYSPFVFPEMRALHQAAKLGSPSVDTRFHLFRRVKEACATLQAPAEDGGSGSKGSRMTAIDRVMMEQNIKQLGELKLTSYRTTARLWEVLAEKTVNLGEAAAVGSQLQAQLRSLDSLFSRVLAADPSSTHILRQYAGFLREMQPNSDKALELMNKADRIDESNTRRRGRALQRVFFGMRHDGQLDESDDRAAVMVISGSPSDLGEVVQVTSGACRLLGCRSPQQMVGTNVDVIVPRPLQAVHMSLLRSFHGQRRSNVVNCTRSVFVATSSGSILPVWMHLSESTPDPLTASPRFAAAFERIATPDNHLIFGTEDDDFRVYAGTSGSLDLLGLSGETLKPEQEPVSAARFLPSLSHSSFEDQLVVTPDQCELTSIAREQPGSPAPDGRVRSRAASELGVEQLSGGGALAGHSVGHDSSTTQQNFATLSRAARLSQAAAGETELGLALSGTTSTFELVTADRLVISIEALVNSVHTPAATEFLIPINGTSRRRMDLVVGSMQRVSTPCCTFHVLRWRSLESVLRFHASAHRPARTPRRRSVTLQQAQPMGGSSGPTPLRLHSALAGGGGGRAIAGRGGGVRMMSPGVQHRPAMLAAHREASAEPLAGASAAMTPARSEANGGGGEAAGIVVRIASPSVTAEPTGRPGATPASVGDSGSQASDGEGGVSVASNEVAVAVHDQPTPRTRPLAGSPSLPSSSRAGSDTSSVGLRDLAPQPVADGAEPSSSAVPRLAAGAAAADGRLNRHHPSALTETAGSDGGRKLPRPMDGPTPTGAASTPGVPLSWRPGGDGQRFGRPSPGSVASSRSSVSSQLINALQRQRTSAEPEVRRIRWVIAIVALSCAAIGVMDLVWLDSVNGKLEHKLYDLLWSGERAFLLEDATLHLYGLVGASAGMNSTRLFNSVAEEAAALVYHAEKIAKVHAMLGYDGQEKHDDAILWEQTAPLVMTEVSSEEAKHPVVHSARNASEPYGLGDWGALDPTLPAPPCRTTADCDPSALTFIAEGSIVYWIGFRDIAAFNALNSAWEAEEHPDFLAPSTDPAEVEQQLAFMNSFDTVATAFAMPMTQYVEYYCTLLRRLGHTAPAQVDYRNRDLRNALGNDELVREATQHTIQRRGKGLINMFPDLQLQLMAAGAAAFVLVATMQGVLLAQLISSLSHRTRAALRLLLLVPRQRCRQLRRTVTVRLARALAEEEGGDTDEDFSEAELPSPSPAGDSRDQEGVTNGAASRPVSTGHWASATTGRDSDVPQAFASRRDSDPGLVDYRGAGRAHSVAGSRASIGRVVLPLDEKLVVPLRPHTDTSRFVMRNVLRYTTPTLLILVWLALLTGFQVMDHRRLMDAAHRSVVVSLMTRESFALYLHLLATVFAADPIHRYHSSRFVDIHVTRMVDLAEKARYGGTVSLESVGYDLSLDALGDSSAGYHAIAVDGCSDVDHTACETVEDGAMASGLYAAVQVLANLARRVLADVPPAEEDPMAPLVYADHPEVYRDLVRVRQLMDPHLRGSLSRVVEEMAAEMTSRVDEMWVFALWVTIAFAVLFMAWAVVALMYVHELSLPLHSARTLLALIPPRVRDTVPALYAALRDIGTDPSMNVHSVTFEPGTARLSSEGGAGRGCCRRRQGRSKR